LIIRTEDVALAVAVGEHREGPALLDDLDASFEDGRDAVRWITLFEERRPG
jgi:hypothetical protein